MLARHLHIGGLLDTHPRLAFRIRWDSLPFRLTPYTRGCHRPFNLPELWRDLFDIPDWKYVNLWSGPRHLVVELLGYVEPPRPLLIATAAHVNRLQFIGVRVDVAGPAPRRKK